MGAAVWSWVRSTGATYFSNAVTLREYRSQLRGSKAAWLWAGYLALLIVATAINYITVARQGLESVAWMQSRLNEHYTMIMEMLAGVTCVVAPALTAASIVAERQARSLDLILTTPMDYRHYLVGKLLSSYRYTWMLLVLSLPVTATCVVLGGATWGDVLNAYIILSAAGLVLSAIGLAISAVATRVVSAVLWTYLAVGAYLGVVSGLAAFAWDSMRFSHPTVDVFQWLIGLSPFVAPYAAPVSVNVWGLHVPASVFALVFAVLVSRLILMAPAAHLAGYGSSVGKALRANLLVYWGVAMFLVTEAFRLIPSDVNADLSPGHIVTRGTLLGLFAAWGAVGLSILIPHLSAYGKDADRKYRNDGMFSLRAAWEGSPAGGLAYILCLTLAGATGLVVGGKMFGALPALADVGSFLAMAFWGLGFLVLLWSLGRLMSSIAGSLAAARALALAAVIAILVLPLPFLTMTSMSGSVWSPDRSPLWGLYILTPVTLDAWRSCTAAYGLVMILAAVLVTLWARRRETRATA